MYKTQKTVGLALNAAMLVAVANTGHAFERNVSVSAIAATTGFGADASWRFHQNLAVTARYTDGLNRHGF